MVGSVVKFLFDFKPGNKANGLVKIERRVGGNIELAYKIYDGEVFWRKEIKIKNKSG